MLLQKLRLFLSRPAAVDIRYKDRQLITANSSQDVTLAEGPPHAVTDKAKRHITCDVAIHVIDMFKTVRINDEQHASPFFHQPLCYLFFCRCLIKKPCQSICLRHSQ